MSLKSDLVVALALIDTPEKWWRGDDGGKGCHCIITAVGQARMHDDTAPLETALAQAAGFSGNELPMRFLVDFNDDPATTHADVLALFDRAIAAAGDA